VVATLTARIATLEAELVAEQQRSAGHRADFERERGAPTNWSPPKTAWSPTWKPSIHS